MLENKVSIKLKYLVESEEAVEHLGLNPDCLNIGADGEVEYTTDLKNIQLWGLEVALMEQYTLRAK